MKDPGIFLFGKKIQLPESPVITNLPATAAAALATEETTCYGEDAACSSEHTLITPHDLKGGANPGDELVDDPKTPSIEEEATPEKSPATGTEGEHKTLKKPDKILPCPRCDSMDTKFCYYNNCNVNQPRHFCKSCQRYWTAGGTMRNMPVGAGRRKKKYLPSSHCRFITISQEAFQSAAAPRIEFAADADRVHVPPPTVLSFSSNPPHSGDRETGDDCSGGSTTTTSNSTTEKLQDNNGFPPPWIPYNPWNSAIPISFPIPAIYPPMPIYPSYWSSVSWLPPVTSAPNLPTLGKHSRDGESMKQKNSVLIPKTLRIDDPDEAAKSSIWATLGIKNENSNRRDLFKAFQAKGDEKKKSTTSTNSPVLQANPAALSRSLCFQERA